MQNYRFSVVILALFTAIGCTEQSLPVFTGPIPASVPAGKPAIGPRLAMGADEVVTLSWMERQEDTSLLRFSYFATGDWQPAVDVVSDADMFVNWADLPAVQPIGQNTLLAHWLSYTADGTYTYQVLTSHSTDSGLNWSTPVSPHDDGTPTEHGFVATFPAAAGTGMVWLDGRHTPDEGMTLRSATMAQDGSVSNEVVLDDLVCDCCQTDVAMTDKGPVIVYRNRTKDEVRDIYVARQINGQWQPGVAVANDGWNISGCPVNGPAIDAIDDLVAIAWFTAADDKPLVKTVFSKDAGRSLSEPILISSKTPLGRVGVAAIDRHSFVVSWLEKEKDGGYAIKIRGLTADGKIGMVYTVGRTELARAVPQMLRVGDELLLAWTDEIGGLSKVASVRVPIAGFYD